MTVITGADAALKFSRVRLTMGHLIKKITPELTPFLTPELTPEITPNYVN